MIQLTGGIIQGQVWEAMTTVVAESGVNIRVEYERAEVAFREYQDKSSHVIVQLREQVNQLNAQIIAEKAHAATITSGHQAKVIALNGKIDTATSLLNQVKQAYQQLNAQIAAVSANNNAIQARITHLTSPAGQNVVNHLQVLHDSGYKY